MGSKALSSVVYVRARIYTKQLSLRDRAQCVCVCVFQYVRYHVPFPKVFPINFQYTVKLYAQTSPRQLSLYNKVNLNVCTIPGGRRYFQSLLRPVPNARGITGKTLNKMEHIFTAHTAVCLSLIHI